MFDPWAGSDGAVTFFIWWIGDHPPRHVPVYDDDAISLRESIRRRCNRWMWPGPVRELSILFANCNGRGGCEGGKKREGALLEQRDFAESRTYAT